MPPKMDTRVVVAVERPVKERVFEQLVAEVEEEPLQLLAEVEPIKELVLEQLVAEVEEEPVLKQLVAEVEEGRVAKAPQPVKEAEDDSSKPVEI